MSLLLLDSDYNIRSELFSNNEQGLWLDPSNMTATKAGWRRNLLTYSESLTTSPWSVNEASLESATPPSGIGLAWKLKETGNSGVHFTGRVLNTVLSAGVRYTLSVYAKAGERNILSIVGESTATTLCDFDLSAGTAHPAASATGTITSVGDGWYRCSMAWVAAASPSTTYFATKQSLAGGLVFTGTLNSGLFLAAAQLELGSTPTEYQKITDFSTEFKAAFPTHAIYQDSNGVTPCTAAGEPVGLILDQSRGGLGALGSELVPDPTLTTTTGWVLDASWTASGGNLVADNSAQASQTFASSPEILTQGKQYLVVIEITAITGAGGIRLDCRPTAGGTGATNHATITTAGTHRTIVNNTGANTRLALRLSSNVQVTTATVASISVREVPGNHAYQTTSGARPTLARIPSSGRRNLLTYSEQFDNAAWTKNRLTTSANAAADDLGNVIADKLIETAVSDTHFCGQNITVTSGQPYTFSVYAKAAERSFIAMGDAGGIARTATFNLTTGAITNVGAAISNPTATDMGNGWWRCSVTYTPSVTTFAAGIGLRTAGGGFYETYLGDGASGVLLAKAQLETGSTATNYQKVVATSNVTESGFNDLWFLSFDGSDDSLLTNAIDFNAWTQETRRNLLLATEDFSNNATWIKTNLGVSGNTMTPDATLGQHRIYQQVTHTTPHVFSVEAKANGYNFISLAYAGGLSGQSIFFDLSNGTISGSLANFTPTITSMGDGWYRCSLAYSATIASTAINHFVFIRNAASIADYSGDGVSGVLLRYPQLEQGSTLTPYQRVGTDEMTVIAGVRKLSDANLGVVLELGSNATNAGAFGLFEPSSNSTPNRTSGFRSESAIALNLPEVLAPVTSVVSAVSKRATPIITLKVNNVLVDTETASHGVGNHANGIIYIGRRSGSTFPYNGHLYQLIVRGKTTPTGKLLEAERFVSKKTGVNL